VPRTDSRDDATGIGHGDRFVYLGPGQRRGQHGDVLATRRCHATVRFDDGCAMLCLAADIHPIRRRPAPMF